MWYPLPDPEICERARRARDPRFDGRFLVAVVTTGIFCRPVCPARTPARDHVRYYPSIASALAAGFRPCLRCRPEAAPLAPLASRSALIGAALERIDAGVLDLGRVDDLAHVLGVSTRQLARQFVAELGVTPGDVARARRLAIAKQLIDETALPFTSVAELAGYASLRRFNEAIAAVWGRPPSSLRRERAVPNTDGAIRIRLALRQPYHREWLLDYLRGRAIAPLERVVGDTWIRQHHGIEIAATLEQDALALAIRGDPRGMRLADLLQRLRRVFDLAADPLLIDAQLGADPRLAASVREDPGLRVPGAWDPFELAVRAILGQQVSVAGATTLAGRLIAQFSDGMAGFPVAARLARESVDAIARIGLPGARAAALLGLARAVDEGRLVLSTGAPPEQLAGALRALPGIGPWTAQYIVMRALGHPDAFPAEDIVLRKALEPGRTLSARELTARAEPWRPWRAYAVMVLWRETARRRRSIARKESQGD